MIFDVKMEYFQMGAMLVVGNHITEETPTITYASFFIS